MRVASEPTHQGKFSVEEANGTRVWYEAVSPVEIDPRLFGARGVGDAADAAFDTKALRDAWDRAAQINDNSRRIIGLGRGEYVLDGDIDCTGIHHTTMFGLGAGASRIRGLQAESGSLFLMGNQGFRARDFRVEMSDELQVEFVERYLFNFDRPDGEKADIDCEFVNVELSRAKHAIRHRGRGLKVQGCLFSLCDKPIDWGWKNPPQLSPYYTPGTGVSEDWGGARGIVVQNNRFHSNMGAWFQNIGVNGEKLTGLMFTGNLGDIGRTMVDTSGRSLTIALNKCEQSTGETCLRFRNGTDNALVIGNTFGGSQGLTVERAPRNFVQVRGATNGVKLLDNYFYHCTQHGVDLRGGVSTGFVARGNTFEKACVQGGPYSPFVFVGPDHTGKVFENDIDSPKRLQGVVLTTDIRASVEVGHHDFWSMAFPLTAGPSQKYHATATEKGTWTPLLNFGGSFLGVVSNAFGTWTRNGKEVSIDFHIELSRKGGSVGAASITGLPHVKLLRSTTSIGAVMSENMTDLSSVIQSQIVDSFHICLYDACETGRTVIDDTNFTDTSAIWGSLIFATP